MIEFIVETMWNGGLALILLVAIAVWLAVVILTLLWYGFYKLCKVIERILDNVIPECK